MSLQLQIIYMPGFPVNLNDSAKALNHNVGAVKQLLLVSTFKPTRTKRKWKFDCCKQVEKKDYSVGLDDDSIWLFIVFQWNRDEIIHRNFSQDQFCLLQIRFSGRFIMAIHNGGVFAPRLKCLMNIKAMSGESGRADARPRGENDGAVIYTIQSSRYFL